MVASKVLIVFLSSESVTLEFHLHFEVSLANLIVCDIYCETFLDQMVDQVSRGAHSSI